MENKYKLTDNTLEITNSKGDITILHQIEALKDFKYVHKGELGGYIESESNLSQEGNCWVGYGVKVLENSVITDNVFVKGHSEIYNSRLWDNAIVSNCLLVKNSSILDNAIVIDVARVEDSTIAANADIRGMESSVVNSVLKGKCKIFKTPISNAEIIGDAFIQGLGDYMVFKNWWSSGRFITWTRSNNMWKAGCFYGTGEDLIKKAYKDSLLSGREYSRVVKYVNDILKDYSSL